MNLSTPIEKIISVNYPAEAGRDVSDLTNSISADLKKILKGVNVTDKNALKTAFQDFYYVTFVDSSPKYVSTAASKGNSLLASYVEQVIHRSLNYMFGPASQNPTKGLIDMIISKGGGEELSPLLYDIIRRLMKTFVISYGRWDGRSAKMSAKVKKVVRKGCRLMGITKLEITDLDKKEFRGYEDNLIQGSNLAVSAIKQYERIQANGLFVENENKAVVENVIKKVDGLLNAVLSGQKEARERRNGHKNKSSSANSNPTLLLSFTYK